MQSSASAASVHSHLDPVFGCNCYAHAQGQGVHAGAQAEGEAAEDVVQADLGFLQGKALARAASGPIACHPQSACQ